MKDTEDNHCPECGEQVLALHCSIMIQSEITPEVTWTEEGPVIERHHHREDLDEEIHFAELECINCGEIWKHRRSMTTAQHSEHEI